MADRVTLLDPCHWRLRHTRPCQGLCEGNHWWYKRHGEYPPCKHIACFEYKGKQYCQIHMGVVLIKEKMKHERTK